MPPHALALRGLRVERQRVLPVIYKGVVLEHGHRLDLVVEESSSLKRSLPSRLLAFLCKKPHGEHGELGRANRELHPNDFRYFCEPS